MKHVLQKNSPRIKLRMAREAEGWTQEEVGARLNSRQITVSRWETGESTPSPYFRKKLSLLFNKSPEELDLAPTRVSGAAPVVIDPLIPFVSHSVVGREQELARLKARLSAPVLTSVVALYGLPGVGKTTLAALLAHNPDIRALFPDGVLWAGLGTTPDIGQLRRWAALLGLHEMQRDSQSIDALNVRVRSAIGDRRMVLVLDDAWTVEDALAFQVGGSGCVHLMTTRFPNVAMHFTPGNPVHIHELNQEQSLDLLHELAPQVVEQEGARVQMLAEAVGGLPLALALTGNYLRMQASSGLRRRLQAALDRLTQAEMRLYLSEPRGPTQRPPGMEETRSLSLHAIIAISDQHVSGQARAALHTLSVLPAKPHHFSEEAALAVSGASVTVLDELLDAGLLENSGEECYRLHQTIADYARLHLQGIAPHERLVQYAHEVVKAHRNDYELLDREAATLLAALEAAYTLGKKQELVRSACELMPYLIMRNNYFLAESSLQRAYEAAATLEDDHPIVTILLYRGQIAKKQGNYTRAEADFHEALLLSRQRKDPERISAALKEIGWASWKLGNYAQAEASLQGALTLARQIGNPESISNVLQSLGALAKDQGQYSQAESYLQEGLTLARAVGNREHLCFLLIHVAITMVEQGKPAQAEKYLAEGLTLARDMDHREWMSALLANLGDLLLQRGEYVQAEIYLREGLALAQQIALPEWMSVSSTNLGVVLFKQGKHSQAEVYLQEGLALARQLGIAQMISNTLHEHGNLQLEQQHIEIADTIFHEMLQTSPAACQDLVALAQYGLARTALAQRNLYRAVQFGEASVTILEAIGHYKAKEVLEWLNDIQMKDGAISISGD